MNQSIDGAYLRNGRNYHNALDHHLTRENDNGEFSDQDIAEALLATGMEKSQLPQPKEVNTYLSALSPGGLKSFYPSSEAPLILPSVPQPFRSQSRTMGSGSFQGSSLFRAPFENQILPQQEGVNLAQAQVKQQPHLKALTHLKALKDPDAVASNPPPEKLPQIPPPPPEPEKQIPGNPPISQTQVMEQVFQQLTQEVNQAEKELSATKSKQGWLGNSWDWIKNTVGASPKGKSWWNPTRWWGSVVNSDEGSKSTGKGLESLRNGLQGLQASIKAGNLEEFKEKYSQLTGKPFDMNAIQGNLTTGKGLLSENEKIQGVKHYQESQKAGVDIIADIGSGLVAFVGYTLAVGGVIAAPFTLGSSLAVTAWGVGVAAAGGAVTKTLIKASDAWSGGQEYDSLGSDLLTGGFSGLLAPLSAGAGATVAKQVGGQVIKRLGIEGAEVALTSTTRVIAGNTVKPMATQLSITGGKTLFRAGVRVTEWGTAGAFAGGLDTPFRHVVHTGSLEGVGEAALHGAVGGAILSPVIGGGLHVAGRGAGKIVKYTMKPKSSGLPAEAVHVEGTPQASSQTSGGTTGTSHPLPEQVPPADYLKQKGQLDFIKDPVLKIQESPSAGMPIMKDMQQMAKHDPALQAALDKRGPEVLGIVTEPGFSPTDQSALFRRGAEKGGVSSGKMCQILADDPTLAPNLRAEMEKMKSQGTPSRTPVQAQETVNQLYGPGKYTVENVLGVGTVGEVWLVKTADGRPQVLKMIKDGVTLKSLEEEEIIWKAFVKSAHKDNPAVRDRSLVMVDRLFKGWKEELDFKIEHQGAEALGKGAKRYDVAKARDIAFVEEAGGVQRGVSIVYDMAPGIKMDTLVEMLKVFRENPIEYQTRYAKEISKHPWLKDPNVWSKDLAPGYLASQNEQALFTSSSTGRTSHGDPHTGNFFVTHENGKLKWTYIDTGLTVTRSPQEVTHHLTMMSDMLLGNSKGLAKKLIAKAESIPLSLEGKPVTRRELEQRLAKLLKERIYESGVDYRDMSTVKRIMDNTLEELGIIQSAQDAVFLKSQLQVLQTYEDLAKVTGMNPKDILTRSMPDISKGLWDCFRQSPLGTTAALKDTIFEFFQHPIKSLRILSKFRPENPPS